MKLWIGVIVLSLFSACGSSETTTPTTPSVSAFYIDSQNGSDTNNGAASSTPWKSFTNLASTSFPTNTTIYLKRGSTWYEQLTVPASDFNIDAYGSGVLPAINGSTEISAWNSLGGSYYSKSVTLTSGDALGNVTEDGAMMSFVAWNDNYTTSLSGAANGSFTFDYPNSTIYIKVGSDPALKTYRASTRLFGINVVGKSNISIKNVSISNFSLVGVNFKNCSICSISNSTISNGGGAVLINFGTGSNPDYLYAGNGVEFGNSSTNGTASNLTISKIFDSGLSPQTYSSNQTAGPFTFSDITISECGFAGIEISVLDNNGTTNSSINTVNMSGITITRSGKGWSGKRYGTEGYGIRVKADAGAGTISGVSLTRAGISSSINSGIKLAGESDVISISRSRIYANDSHGIEVAEASATSLRLDLSTSLIYANGGSGLNYNSITAAGFNVLHNTFYGNTTINLAVFNQLGTAKIQNNIFHGSMDMAHIYVADTLSGATVNNNCYQNQSVVDMFAYNGTAYKTVTAFNISTGFEANGTGAGGIGLSNPDGGVFSISVGSSSCDGLGDSTVGITTDYAGNGYANPPASGAFEAQ
ncbi:MAG: right-handed parallel beta-helix repeat-containing protein [Gammaproteobacteria bacterium]|nr:right-handed parallel beta-helix repeat-containing protein [Gammaproteobacteria bacterium]